MIQMQIMNDCFCPKSFKLLYLEMEGEDSVDFSFWNRGTVNDETQLIFIFRCQEGHLNEKEHFGDLCEEVEGRYKADKSKARVHLHGIIRRIKTIKPT